MSCRCSDILNCQSDIRVIGNIIDDIVNAQNQENTITNSYVTLASFCNLTFIVEDMTKLTNKVKGLNDYLVDTIPTVLSKCNSQLGGLQLQLHYMQSEDSSYHEELARQAREGEESKSSAKGSRK